MLEYRYANILTVMAIAFLYSGGMPLLYPVAAIFFAVTYWVDKCLLFKSYRKPIMFNNYLALRTLTYFKYILILHVIGVLFMYGVSPIVDNDLFGSTGPQEINLDDTEG